MRPRDAHPAAILIAACVFAVIGRQPEARQDERAQHTFDVASIKRNPGGEGTVRLGVQPGGLFVATNVSVRPLLQYAYQVRDAQIVGGPGWIASDRFNVTAKASADASPEAIRSMTRALLEERFKLKSHRETREMPVYSLVLANSDGRFGRNLVKSTGQCLQKLTCGVQTGGDARVRTLIGGNVELARLAASLTGFMDRFVFDRTNLKGEFDFDLSWSPDTSAALPASDVNHTPDIFTALQEQLGLKLQPDRGQVEVVVVDAIDRPSPD